MENNIIKVMESENFYTFFFFSDGVGFWYWTVDRVDVDNYNGTLEEFVNDENNETLGASVADFDTLEDALNDYNNN